jgi:hypothetical protein
MTSNSSGYGSLVRYSPEIVVKREGKEQLNAALFMVQIDTTLSKWSACCGLVFLRKRLDLATDLIVCVLYWAQAGVAYPDDFWYGSLF